MGRRRTGTAYEKRGTLYVSLHLPDGKRWTARLQDALGREPDKRFTLTYARAVAKTLQHGLDAGTWSPPEKGARRAQPKETHETVGTWCTHWAKQITYESAEEDQGALRRYLVPAPLARVRLEELRPRHALDWIAYLIARPSHRGGCLAPRTVRNVYDVARRALDEAVLREHLLSNPLAGAARKRLPSIEDKDPTARASWCYTPAEVAKLLEATSLPPDRRVLNALRFLTGARIGELCALRWRAWDRSMAPLTRITFSVAIKSRSRVEGPTKTRAVKHAPVHPILERLLVAWWESGWAAWYGRAPTAEDYVVPVRWTLRPYRDESNPNTMFKRDCRRLGLPVHHQHVARHTFVSLTQDAGGDGTVLQWITHAPPATATSGYTRAQWSRLCAEISKLHLPIRTDTATRIATGLEEGSGEQQ